MDKNFYRTVVVDSIIGLDQENWTDVLVTPRRDGTFVREQVTWHRDEEPFDPWIRETDIRIMAEKIKATPSNCWWPFPIDKVLQPAIEDNVDICKQLGTELCFDDNDYQSMKADLLNRLKQRLQKYCDGKYVEVKELCDGLYGFRFS